MRRPVCYGRFVHVATSAMFMLVLAAATPASAQLAIFNFEGLAATYTDPPDGPRPGAITFLSQSNNGVTMDLSRTSGTGFDIVGNTGGQGGKPASWGLKSLDPFFASTTADTFLANFNTKLFKLSLDFGDYGADSDTGSITFYSGPNGTGSVVGTTSSFYGFSAFPTFNTMSFSSVDTFQSAKFVGGSSAFPNSVFYDNIQVSAVPEGDSLALLAAGLVPMSLLVSRKRKNRTAH